MNVRGSVVDGLKALFVLRLNGTPAAADMESVGQVWIKVVEQHQKWDAKRDAGRLEAAFEKLIAEVDRWPSPSELLRRLPPRIEIALPSRKRSDDEVVEVVSTLDALSKKMKMGRNMTAEEKWQQSCRRAGNDCSEAEMMIAAGDYSGAAAMLNHMMSRVRDVISDLRLKEKGNLGNKYNGGRK